MSVVYELRKGCRSDLFDYQFLMAHMQSYKDPRKKVTQLLRKGEIVRLKKGLYVFGEQHRRAPISKEQVANALYGPSYVSLSYALGRYQLIPERVEEVTSVTTQRNKVLSTPVARFSYSHLNQHRYAIGVDRIAIENGGHYLIACPEKALIDVVARETDLTRQDDLYAFLTENLRIDEDDLLSLDRDRLESIVAGYRSPVATRLSSLLRRLAK